MAKPDWWTNGKACSRIPRVIEIWREQGSVVTPLYGERALLDAERRGMEGVLDDLIAHELYRYRPKAFEGFIAYVRTKADEVEP